MKTENETACVVKTDDTTALEQNLTKLFGQTGWRIKVFNKGDIDWDDNDLYVLDLPEGVSTVVQVYFETPLTKKHTKFFLEYTCGEPAAKMVKWSTVAEFTKGASDACNANY